MREHQATLFGLGKEGMNARGGVAQNKIGACHGAVADAQPDHLGRTAEKKASLREVRILADDGEVVCLGVLPDLRVGSSAKTAIAKVERAGVEIGYCQCQAMREILIQQELHSETISNLRSVSAAKA